MNALKLVGGVILGFALLVPAPAYAQLGTGDLRGKVVDSSGAVLPGATVIAKNEASGQYRETISSTDGTFSMIALMPGNYELTASLSGFKKYQRAGVRVEVGKAVSIDIALPIGGIEEQVTVTAETPLVDTSSKQIGGVVTSQELSDIPSINRNFTTYLGTLPGVTAFISTDSFGADSIRINGQGTQNVNYTLDGAGNNDTFNGGNGGAQARTPVEAIQEFQLLTSQFDAEFGASSGGVVNAVSKSGTNAYRGVLFYFNANQDLTAKNYFAVKQNLAEAPTKQIQFGGNVGGPIIKDKLHFFANLERIDQNRGVTINIPARPELNFSDFTHDNVWNWMVRMDHQINGSNTWAVRYLRESSPQSNQFTNTTFTKSRAEKETDTDYSIVGTLNSVIGGTKVNSLKLSYTKEDVFFGNPGYFDIGDQSQLGPNLPHQTFTDGISPRASRRMDPTYQFDETFAWFVPGKRGDHDLKFGVNVAHSPLHIYDAGTLNGSFGFSASDADFNAANPRTYPDRLTIRVPSPSDFIVTGTYYGVFVQDKWKINNRMTASLGVRWDTERLPIEEKDNPKFASPDDYPKDLNNFAPRIGLTWSLDEAGSSVVRGGWGKFYQKTPFTFLTGVVSSGVYSNSFTVQFPANNIDAGPSQGRLPTEPFLVNGPVVNRALLNSMFPTGTLQKNTGTVQFDNPNRTVPYTRQASIGYEKQFGTAMAASVDYIRNDLRELYIRQDLNPGTRATTARTAPVTRLLPTSAFTASVLEITNLGWANSNSLQFSVVKRYSRGYQYRASYTLSNTFGNVPSPGAIDTVSTQVGTDLHLEDGEARTTQDRPHVLSLTGAAEIPKTGGLQLSGSFQYQSGTPFTLTDSTTDPNRNGQFEEPLPAGSYSGNPNNSDAITVENIGGFRGARGPDLMLLSIRGRYSFRLSGNRSLQAWVDVFNVTNRANFNTPTGDRRDAATFLILRSVSNPTRTAQLNFRFTF